MQKNAHNTYSSHNGFSNGGGNHSVNIQKYVDATRTS